MLDRKYRGRRKGVPIREGSVRQARQELGLSLAEIAGDEVSRTAIHLIEHGRTRPSFETLQQIARRTRKPLEFFLPALDDPPVLTQPQRQLRELEMLTQKRDFEQVIAAGVPLLEKRWNKAQAALIRFFVGQAYCRLVRPDEALRHLPAAREHFERAGDEWMAIEAMDWEAAALGLKEDPAAIPLATSALERCRKLHPRPAQTEARIHGHIAGMHLVAQSWAQAIRSYHAAAEAAGSVKDLLLEAKMHHGLGLAYHRLREPVTARKHFDRALALYSIESDPTALYRVENDLGRLLLEGGQLDSAEDHLMKALAACESSRMDRRGRGFILTSVGELNLKRGRVDVAQEYLDDALRAGEATGEHIVLAEAHALMGQVAEQRGQRAGADGHFDVALSLLEDLEMPDRLRDCHIAYAELLEARGDVVSAAGHWKQAAQIGRHAPTDLGWPAGRAEAAVSSPAS